MLVSGLTARRRLTVHRCGSKHVRRCCLPNCAVALAHYAKLRIDAHTKRLVFSDGLDLERALMLYRHFGDRTQLGFGIGTHLTNDMGDPAVAPEMRPLNIVMKLVRANGQPVAKLSDTPGKTLCDDETYLAYLRQVFNVAN